MKRKVNSVILQHTYSDASHILYISITFLWFEAIYNNPVFSENQEPGLFAIGQMFNPASFVSAMQKKKKWKKLIRYLVSKKKLYTFREIK